MAEYLGIPPKRIHVVPLGVNLKGYDARARSRDDRSRVGYFGRIAPEKGLHELCRCVRSYSRLCVHPPSARVEAGGMAPEHGEYLAATSSAPGGTGGLAGDFHYRGAVDREGQARVSIVRSMFVVPARTPNRRGSFLLEAMASGVPIVTAPRLVPRDRHARGRRVGRRAERSRRARRRDPLAVAGPRLRLRLYGRAGAVGARRHYSAAAGWPIARWRSTAVSRPSGSVSPRKRDGSRVTKPC